jgi:hypothetical protein
MIYGMMICRDSNCFEGIFPSRFRIEKILKPEYLQWRSKVQLARWFFTTLTHALQSVGKVASTAAVAFAVAFRRSSISSKFSPGHVGNKQLKFILPSWFDVILMQISFKLVLSMTLWAYDTDLFSEEYEMVVYVSAFYVSVVSFRGLFARF